MSTVRMAAPVAALAALVTFAPAAAHAQDSRFSVSFTPAVATVGGDGELALSGIISYRFSERFSFEGDLTWIDAAAGGFRDREFAVDGQSFDASGLWELVRRQTPSFGRGRLPGLPALPNFPSLPIGIGQLRADADGSTLVGTLGIRYQFPVQTERFRPYVAGGLGINNTEQEFSLDATAFTPAIDESTSHTGYAFNAGAGASVRIAGQFWADVDARYFRLSRDRDIMRLGGGVSVRF